MTENGKKVVAAFQADKKLQELAKDVKSREELVKILNANGLPCDLADFDGATAPKGKVSLDELKAVAGGKTCACVIGGGGGSNKDQNWCGCPIIGSGGLETQCYCVVGGGGDLPDC